MADAGQVQDNARRQSWPRLRRWWNGGSLDDDFDTIAYLLERRTGTLKTAMEKLQQISPSTFGDNQNLLFRLASVDLFVEKAQAVLTARARRMSRAGTLVSLAAIAALGGLSWYIAYHAGKVPKDLSRNELILRIVSAISLGAIVIVAVRYMVALARSFFHESVTLLSRRHALRFGRMYLYLNHEDVKLEDLREAFDWNRGGDSSFLDIRPNEISQTPYGAIAKSVSDAISKGVNDTLDAVKNRGKSEPDDGTADQAA
jgi:hypothetical protein